jgi:hypothetical protein
MPHGIESEGSVSQKLFLPHPDDGRAGMKKRGAKRTFKRNP